MLDVVRLSEVAVVTGEDSPNRTGSGFGVYGTDLGILWDNGNGEILAAFGDTYGLGWAPPGTGPDHADWRCNVLAASTTTDLAGGLALYPAATRPDGIAAQILDRDPGARREVTVIPTAGIAVDGIDYLHYMSVRRWGAPGHWDTTYAGIAVSADHGRTWRKPPESRWQNKRHRHPFQMGAFVREGDHVYLVGTPAGRFGSASLARVAAPSVSDVDAYEYWTGRSWVRDPFAAVPVFAGPVGELSVQYHRSLGRWLEIHLDEQRAAIVLRSAPRLTGPWSEPVTVVSGRDYPGLYGGYLHPWALDGPDIYFTMSQWVPYHVILLRATLDDVAATTR